MTVSVIIVNYNVRYFLEQCLHSVLSAIRGTDAEVLVIDNASTDDSLEYLTPSFPWVRFIKSEVNLGFATANNVALKEASGEYILFLNPDTLLPEDCIRKCLDFMESNDRAGALGVRMIDGSGSFLQESKRSFPNTRTAFYKLVGLSALFPRSKIFNQYSLGYLDEYQDHRVDVLSGAFMMVRRKVLDKVGSFDDAFFMYAEDVDLSYRIQQAGFENWYVSRTSIIHFKGESTRKGSLNYVKMFYKAMSVFVLKHYKGKRARGFVSSIQVAIWVRAFFTWINQFISRAGLTVLDGVLILLSLKIAEKAWVNLVRDGEPFIASMVNVALPAFALVFLSAAAFAGLYDKKYKPGKTFLSAAIAIVITLAAYSLVPEQYRFSRGVILTGGILSSLSIAFSRWVLSRFGWIDSPEEPGDIQTVIVGTPDAYEECLQLLKKSHLEERVIGRVSIAGGNDDAIGSITELPNLMKMTRITEVIFCAGALQYSTIINIIQKLPKGTNYRFHAEGSQSIIGSDSKDVSGLAFSSEINFSIAEPYSRRMKRLNDMIVSLLLIISFPLHLVLLPNGWQAIKNAFQVLIGQKTWVSYTIHDEALPFLKPGVLSPGGYPVALPHILPTVNLMRIDRLYAKDFDWTIDLKIIVENYYRLGGSI